MAGVMPYLKRNTLVRTVSKENKHLCEKNKKRKSSP